MEHWLTRTEQLIGKESVDTLAQARVAVLGLGGVGSAAAEGLVRAGVGSVLLIDHDTISITNCNRQLFATTETIGQPKCDAAKKRLSAIHPKCEIACAKVFFTAESHAVLLDYHPDFVVDAIDTVSAKLDLAELCHANNIPLICCLGTGNRLNAAAFRVGDIADTVGCGCGLARVMRRELKKRGILSQPVVFSTELPRNVVCDDSEQGRHAPASISFCPPVAGYLMAGYAVNTLLKID